MSLTNKLKLQTEPTCLLGQRVQLRIPEGSWVDGHHEGGLMGVEVDNLREQRVGTDYGPSRLIMLAEDTMLLAGGGLESMRQRLLDGVTRGYGVTFEELPDAPEGGLLMGTLSQAPEREALPLLVLWLEHPDGTLLKLNWFVNAEGVILWRDWLEVASAMARSATAGDRSIQREARVVTLDWCHTPAVELDLLPDFVLSADRGHDFVVHRLDELRSLDGFGASLGVYLGQHPAPHVSRMSPRPELEEVAGSLMGQQMSWIRYELEGCVKMEAIEPLEHARVMMHAFATGADDEDCRRVARMVEGLRAAG